MEFIVQIIIIVKPLQEVSEMLRGCEVGNIDVRVGRRNGGVIGAASYNRNRRGFGQSAEEFLSDVIATQFIFKGQIEFVCLETVLRLWTAFVTAFAVNVNVHLTVTFLDDLDSGMLVVYSTRFFAFCWYMMAVRLLYIKQPSKILK